MIFLTVGSRYGFDRLVRGIDELIETGVITEAITAQIGDGAYEPTHMAFDRFLPGDEYDARVRGADRLIGHAGSGTVALAATYVKPLLVLPRLHRYREHVNDHQLATARTFERLGAILAATEVDELPSKYAQLKAFVPRRRIPNVDGLAGRIGDFLRSVR